MTDLRQTKEFAQHLQSQGWLTEKINNDFAFIRRIPLTPFSIIKIQRPTQFDFEKIHKLAKKHRALATYLEPKGIKNISLKSKLRENNYSLSKSPFLPTKTIQLDLTLSEKEILAQMKKDARYSIRRAEKNNIKVKRLKDNNEIHKFRQAWKKSVDWRRHVPSLKNLISLNESFGPKVFFLITKDSLAGTIILLSNTTAYYFYAFTSKKGRKNLAQYLMVWKAIKLAKKNYCKIFDFEGVYDPRFPIKAWQGFSHFKNSFGGKEIKHPGCYKKMTLL